MEKHFIPNPSLRSKENLFRFVYTRNSPRFLTPDLFPCWIPINRKLSPHALGCVRLKTQGALPNCEGRAVFLSIAFQNSLSGVPAIPFFSWSIYLRVTNIPYKLSLFYTLSLAYCLEWCIISRSSSCARHQGGSKRWFLTIQVSFHLDSTVFIVPDIHLALNTYCLLGKLLMYVTLIP